MQIKIKQKQLIEKILKKKKITHQPKVVHTKSNSLPFSPSFTNPKELNPSLLSSFLAPTTFPVPDPKFSFELALVCETVEMKLNCWGYAE